MSSPKLPQNFGRAFDLSSLAKPKPTSTASTRTAREVTPENLLEDFVKLSQKILVVLLAWSNSAPDSLTTLSILDTLAEEDAGKWILGSVNLDAHPALAQALQVKVIPFGLALIQEQGVPLIDSSATASQLRAVINKVLELAKERGIGSGSTESKNAGDPSATGEEQLPPEEVEEVQAAQALEKGDFVSAASEYKKLLNRKPGDLMAQLGLAQCELMVRISGLDFAEILARASSKPESLKVQIQASDIEIAQGQYQSAFDRLITLIKILEGDEKKKAKEHLLVLFTLIDPADPILIKARSALANALF